MTVTAIIAFLFIFSFVVWQYIFSIYETRVEVIPDKVIVGDTAVVRLIPLNSFGKKAPLRKIEEKVKIAEGAENIEVLPTGSKTDFNFKGVHQGKITLYVSSEFSLETNLIKIDILSN